MDIAGVIGEGAWAVVKNILTIGIIALILVALAMAYLAQRRQNEERAFAEGRAIRSPSGEVLIFQTLERRQKYEAGLYNDRWGFYYDDQAQKDAHESGDLVLHEGKLLTPEQKIREERRLEEKRRREEERANRPKRQAFTATERAVVRDALYKKQQGRCIACRRKMPKDVFHIDHILPVAEGGTNEVRNLQLLCPTCNTRKGQRDNNEFIRETRQRQRQRR